MNKRADNHKSLQQLSRMERFALMYGHPLKAMKEEHPKETAYRETEELVEANMEREPVAWKTGTFFTEYKETAESWEAKGWPVTALYE